MVAGRNSAESYLAVAMLPEYAEKEKNPKLTEAMKSQGIYTRSGGQWYFGLTEEQYDELVKPYWEAYDMAQEKIKDHGVRPKIHAISECMGNKRLINFCKCYDCNHLFGEITENYLGKY